MMIVQVALRDYSILKEYVLKQFQKIIILIIMIIYIKNVMINVKNVVN